MDRQTLTVDIHREPPGYWAHVRELKGCFASGSTFDELLVALHDAVAMYVGEDELDRILTRVSVLQLEVEPDLRPAESEQLDSAPAGRKRQAHRDDWPPESHLHRRPEGA